jgi:hypothetical protein
MPNKWVNVELIEQTPIYLKIDCAGKIPPLKLFVRYAEEPKQVSRTRKSLKKPAEVKADWKVFASDRIPEPNEVNNQYLF